MTHCLILAKYGHVHDGKEHLNFKTTFISLYSSRRQRNLNDSKEPCLSSQHDNMRTVFLENPLCGGVKYALVWMGSDSEPIFHQGRL